ncbi:Dishevelled associated activator of morphogenesis 2 [Physocladia obscura]|uniref:Dishevelled associated activator of morphogenesis 2 n=1 Tax=Physocladia obscura TaxID=109957 RepID=A0AAD5XCV3_9FUNG|nr:Dishevelled associated activator of morphogenesis 2 [Physocladia obscura]
MAGSIPLCPLPPVGFPGCPPPPPPAPGMPGVPPPGLPKRPQNFKPTGEVRRLQWDRLPDPVIKESVWLKKISLKSANVSGESADDIDTKLNSEGIFRDIQARFGIKPKQVKGVSADVDMKEPSVPAAAINGKQAEIGLIDGKKAQNMSLVSFKNFFQTKILMVGVDSDYVGLDEKFASETVMMQLISFLPTKDEEKALRAFKGDVSSLRKAEQLLLEFLNIPHREYVMNTILFKLTFEERFKSLDDDLCCGLSAVSCLNKCEQFMKLLEIILSLGNFMNCGTFIGAVHGFRINSINKLADVKSTEGGGSLLHFLAEIVDSSSSVDLQLQKKYAVNLDILRSDLKLLQKGLQDICKTVELLSKKESENTMTFVQIITPFSEECSVSLGILQDKISKLETEFFKTVAFFGEDEKKTPFDEFFGMFRTFLQSYERAVSENIAEREKKEKLAKRQQLQKVLKPSHRFNRSGERDARRAKTTSKLLPSFKIDGSRSTMDDILINLKEGTGFHDNQTESALEMSRSLAQNSKFRNPLEMRSPCDWSTSRKVSAGERIGQAAAELLQQLSK